jgi:hypothetical protein
MLRVEDKDAVKKLASMHKIEAVVREEKGVPEECLSLVLRRIRTHLPRHREPRFPRSGPRCTALRPERVKLAAPQLGWRALVCKAVLAARPAAASSEAQRHHCLPCPSPSRCPPYKAAPGVSAMCIRCIFSGNNAAARRSRRLA